MSDKSLQNHNQDEALQSSEGIDNQSSNLPSMESETDLNDLLKKSSTP